MEITLPIRPLRTSSHALMNSSEERCWLPVWKTRWYLRTTFTIVRASRTVRDMGFSQ